MRAVAIVNLRRMPGAYISNLNEIGLCPLTVNTNCTIPSSNYSSYTMGVTVEQISVLTPIMSIAKLDSQGMEKRSPKRVILCPSIILARLKMAKSLIPLAIEVALQTS